MKETITNCYCDMPHNGQKVAGASPVNVIAMSTDASGNESMVNVTLDMCEACRALYKANLLISYDGNRKPVYAFRASSGN